MLFRGLVRRRTPVQNEADRSGRPRRGPRPPKPGPSLRPVNGSSPLSRERSIAGGSPHGERDFGAVYQLADGRWTTTRPARREDERERVFWKLDYFDRALEFASEDAADPRITRRVLTIMLASEY